MKNNAIEHTFRLAYLAGFFVILALPLLALPPYFFPPDWGKTIVFRSVLTILLIVFIFQFVFGRESLALPRLKKNVVFWLLAAFLMVLLLASIFSVDPYFSFWGSPYRGGGFVTLAFYGLFTVLTFMVCERRDWKKALNFSIIIGTLVSLVAVIQYYGLLHRIFTPMPGRPVSTMGNPILLATYLLLLFFLTLSFAVQEKSLWKKAFYICALVLFFYVILITGARAAYLGLTVSILYFLLWYPKKIYPTASASQGNAASRKTGSFDRIKIIKIATVVLLFLMVGFFSYVNSAKQYPAFLEQNKIFNSVAKRLSIGLILNDSRFYAWTRVDYKLLLEKPILGYGPENFSVGFDTYYDPSIPYLGGVVGWWDRAHNVIIQTGSDAGLLGIIAYLALWIALFWSLHKSKHQTEHTNTQITIHGIQTALIGYFTANFFSFDSFSTYLIFFLMIGYSLHLTSLNSAEITLNNTQKNADISGKIVVNQMSKYKRAPTMILFILLTWFLWQYNMAPFFINAKINKAADLANRKYCSQALGLMETVLLKHSLLDSYARLQYVEFTKTCANFYPENNVAYQKRDLELVSEAVKIQPLYTRYWILLGSSSSTLASQEKNPELKNNLLKQADGYFNKALALAPKHQEIPIEQARMEIIAGNYVIAQEYAKKCIALNPNLGDCYFKLALADIYVKDKNGTQENLELAFKKRYDVNSKPSLDQLSDAYGSIADYQNLVVVYEKLVALDPKIAQYHSSLAYFYGKLGQYDKARQEALKVLELSPESKPNVDAFLKALP